MSSSQTLAPKLPIGIPCNLDSRARHLFKLLKHLPASVPLDPPDDNSTYHFFLDPEDVADEGEMYAFNCRLEVTFQTHKLHGAKLVFKECGKRLGTLKLFLKQNIKKNSLPDARGHQNRWVERLITAASDSGAKIPPKRCLDIDSDDDLPRKTSETIQYDSASPSVPAVSTTSPSSTSTPPVSTSMLSASAASPRLPSMTPPPKPATNATASAALCPGLQQRKLFQFGTKKLSPAELKSQQKKHSTEAKVRCLAATEQEKRQKEHTADRKRELMREWQQRFLDQKKATGDSTGKKGEGKAASATASWCLKRTPFVLYAKTP
ncbi:hypothetical protein DFH08DRAFT_799470 [Mycena albidolilacea]|uniref:Uncharacterized protein n=1 Tax=Mycena albidolilacea TaxID=1033008 RepID=A0AAD7ALU4_9AGAR|nr:hypothetical protein DFH08DRAFT_799470 [Mycena albidolilacea]